METIFRGKEIELRWKVISRYTKEPVDFEAVEGKVFIIGPDNKYVKPFSVVRDTFRGLSVSIDTAGLSTGVYDAKVVWLNDSLAGKNDYRNVSVKRNVFAVSDIPSEITTNKDVINIITNEEVYGKDGMSAYELAVFRGLTLNESEWLDKSGELLIPITHAELKGLKESGYLIEGVKYRITDYETTSSTSNTECAGHAFDLIVEALSASELSEEAKVCRSKRDTEGYFANCKLSAWDVKYCLDNDASRFGWADEENGKGVIYYMKDERGNECPYDFKNIKVFVEGAYHYTFALQTADGYVDFSVEAMNKKMPSSPCSNNVIKPFVDKAVAQAINFICIITPRDADTNVCCQGNRFDNSCIYITAKDGLLANCYFGNYCKYININGSASNVTFYNQCHYISLKSMDDSSLGPFVSCIDFIAPYASNVRVDSNNNGVSAYSTIGTSDTDIYNLTIRSGVITSTAQTIEVNTNKNYPTYVERGMDGRVNVYSDIYSKLGNVVNENLFLNSGFDGEISEGALSQWMLRGTEEAEIVEEVVDGEAVKCLQGGKLSISQYVPIKIGKVYTLSFWVNPKRNRDVIIKSGGFKMDEVNRIQKYLPLNNWSKISVTFEAKDGDSPESNMSITIDNGENQPTGTHCSICLPKLEVGDAATAYARNETDYASKYESISSGSITHIEKISEASYAEKLAAGTLSNTTIYCIV